ncbi:MAG: amino-acid N-acetyltransferase [Sutterellaceae bacterium]|nr:amino-acid N-acetyltransferase [Sutterellaceae bacterium]
MSNETHIANLISEPSDCEVTHWVSWMRSVAPYVHQHHGRTFVISFAGEVVKDKTLLNRLVMDVSLMASMGVRLVIVHGSRPQIEELMKLRQLEGHFYKGTRITEPEVLECVKEACGETRFDIEAAFSQGLPNTPMQHARIKVISGNFVTASPLGVVDGVDYQHTGVVRKVDSDSIKDLLSRGNIVLVSPFGFSATGEAFNITTEDVATAIASAIDADKLILMVGVDGIHMNGELLQELTQDQLQKYLDTKALDDEDTYNAGFALRALKAGVDRVHVVPWSVDGALLTELFTHKGLGTMIAEEDMDSIRQATADDVGGLIKLLEIYEADGTLVKRPREKIEREIDHFTVLEHDGVLYGSAALYPYPEAKIGEMAAVAVHPDYHGAGDGDRLLRRIEQRAKEMGLTRIFVLTTRTAHWFIKRGFEPAHVDDLPMEKQRLYNWNRRSQIFIKKLV